MNPTITGCPAPSGIIDDIVQCVKGFKNRCLKVLQSGDVQGVFATGKDLCIVLLGKGRGKGVKVPGGNRTKKYSGGGRYNPAPPQKKLRNEKEIIHKKISCTTDQN